MNCQQVNKYILDYCDNRLSPVLSKDIEEHLKGCSMCSKAVSLCKAENIVLYNLEKYEPSPDFTNKVMQSIKSRPMVNQPSQIMKKANIYFRILPMAATVAAVILLLCTINLSNVFNFNISANKEATTKSPQIAQDTIPVKQEIHIAQSDMINERALEDQAHEDLATTEEEVLTISKSKKEESSYGTYTISQIANFNDEGVNFIPPGDYSLEKLQLSSRAETVKTTSVVNENNIDLHIQNVPAEYTLLEIKDNEDNSITYCYTDESQQITLDITISKVVNDEQTISQETTAKAKQLAAEPEKLDDDLNLNTLTWEMEKDNQTYIINIQSNLSAEDIIKLYSIITFTE